MIIDRINALNSYTKLNPYLSEVSDFLSTIDADAILAGKHVLTDNVFFYCFEYQTKLEVLTGEAHEAYWDVHVLLKGCETVGVSPLYDAISVGEYDAENDYKLFCGSFQLFDVAENQFIILMPHEGHITGKASNDVVEGVKKLVFKVPAVF